MTRKYTAAPMAREISAPLRFVRLNHWTACSRASPFMKPCMSRAAPPMTEVGNRPITGRARAGKAIARADCQFI